MTALILAALHHDYRKQRSFVTLEWSDEPEKRLGLPVPFKCTEDRVQAEAEKAIKAMANELEQSTIVRPKVRAAPRIRQPATKMQPHWR